MKVAGFTIVRNAVLFDYPIKEAITSILPICDEFYVAVGESEDETLDLIESIESAKINIVKTKWNLKRREGGTVLAEETNKAFDAIPEHYDWCFYIQGDEVVHEKYLASIKTCMLEHLNNQQVEGLLFNYKHFYGSYNYEGDSRKWYRKEVRVIRNDKSIRSYKDAQGFRKNGEKLWVKPVGAFVYHYGWVKPPEKQLDKQKQFHKFWHDDVTVERMVGQSEHFDYSGIDSLAKFEGTHPAVMLHRVSTKNWDFQFDLSKKNFNAKGWFLYALERLFGVRIGEYKNYRIRR